MNRSMTAGRLSALLYTVLGLMTLGLVIGSVVTGIGLIHRSQDATHAQIDASVSADDPTRLAELQRYLQIHESTIDETAALASGIGGYDQSKIVATINGYATKAGVTVSGFNFSSAVPGAAGSGTPASNGTFGLSLASPLAYNRFIIFMQLLENGLMPAKITAGTVSPDTTNPGNVIVSPLTLKVAGS